MPMLFVVLALFTVAVPRDSARLAGHTLIVEPAGVSIELPPQWFGAKDSTDWPPSCGHDVSGPVERRLIVSRDALRSLPPAAGEWDREYAAVTDSMLPKARLIAQLGPEPLGDGHCFADLQLRVYILPSDSALSERARAVGLATARNFFPSAQLTGRDSAQWRIDRLRWNARYYDYGGEANIELYSARVGSETIAMVFMHATLPAGAAARDQGFILTHIQRP